MTPTKENAGEFWWLLEPGDDDPIVVEISLSYCHGEIQLVYYYTGWEMSFLVDKPASPSCKWLGRAVPPEEALRRPKCPL